MKNYREQIQQFVQTHQADMLELWKELVNLEGCTDEPENVKKVQNRVRAELAELGFRCWEEPSRPDRCSVLLGVLGEERPGKPVVFGGHLDTVHATGAFGGANPFKIEDGRAYGPGVLDMKGGIVIALYVIRALQELGYTDRPIKIIFSCEEEKDHVGTDVDQVYMNNSKGALCAFNMETGHITNSLCVGRKTIYTFYATVHGKGGHAGNEFDKGRNALLEAAHKIVQLAALTDLEKGTTVTPSICRCGTHTAGIPGDCELAFDVRILQQAEGDRIEREFKRIMETSYVPDTHTEYRLDKAKLLVFERTEGTMRLLEFVNHIAEQNGYAPFGNITLGGASDAGAMCKAGVPCLCSCGVIGEFNHSLKEYAVVQSLFDRTVIYALTILALKDFQ